MGSWNNIGIQRLLVSFIGLFLILIFILLFPLFLKSIVFCFLLMDLLVLRVLIFQIRSIVLFFGWLFFFWRFRMIISNIVFLSLLVIRRTIVHVCEIINKILRNYIFNIILNVAKQILVVLLLFELLIHQIVLHQLLTLNLRNQLADIIGLNRQNRRNQRTSYS